jgi:hypothetical protein
MSVIASAISYVPPPTPTSYANNGAQVFSWAPFPTAQGYNIYLYSSNIATGATAPYTSSFTTGTSISFYGLSPASNWFITNAVVSHGQVTTNPTIALTTNIQNAPKSAAAFAPTTLLEISSMKTVLSTIGYGTYTVPANANGKSTIGVNAYIWGGAGGYGNQNPGYGGAGGYVSGYINAPGSTMMTWVVGAPGIGVGNGTGNGQGTILTGGGSGTSANFVASGGFCALFNVSTPTSAAQNNVIAVAGGGGSCGQYSYGFGGAGGYPVGISSTGGQTSNDRGYGGTQTAPGYGTDNSLGLIHATSGMLGIYGGGGGYYGGGGGIYGAGGGGSSYVGGFAGNINYASGMYASTGTLVNTTTVLYPGGAYNSNYISQFGACSCNFYNNGMIVLYPVIAGATPFSATGTYQYYTVPSNVTNITFYAWGAGGGAMSAYGNTVGGAGAYMTGILTVVPGEVLKIIVGVGGASTGSSGTYLYYGQQTDAQGGGGGGSRQGGGRTEIQKLVGGIYTSILIAGGGGGANCGNYGANGGNAYYTGTSQQGGGAYVNGQQGGMGGSQTAGGAGGAYLGPSLIADSGTRGFGGNGTLSCTLAGSYPGSSGGGGGYYGGGGGSQLVGGGGGSSYYNASYVTNLTGINGNSNVPVASNAVAGYVSGAGMGGSNPSWYGSNGCLLLYV